MSSLWPVREDDVEHCLAISAAVGKRDPLVAQPGQRKPLAARLEGRQPLEETPQAGQGRAATGPYQ
jgi:hypothetical protein